MSRDDAKRALEIIKTIQNGKHDEYSDDLCTTVIERLMKRTVNDYKQLLRDQQDSALELWVTKDGTGYVSPVHHDTYDEAKKWIEGMVKEYPRGRFQDNKPALFREVMDND